MPKKSIKTVVTDNTESKPAQPDSGIIIREIRKEELGKAASLIARLKRLNGEFDPLLKTTDSLESEAQRAVERVASNGDSLIMLALVGSKVVGVVKADLKDRTFYEPRREGAIDEFYILPEFRRGSLGKDLLASISEKLKGRGAELITAEFPSQNEIAKRFYTKLGFRSLTNVYAKAES
jgi:ribosomal protein S18 acetylase RimI-like enzyme